MTPKEAMAILAAAFRQERLERPTVELYAKKLSDIPPTWLEMAVNSIIDHSKFFPSIAEIRETAAKLAGVLPPSAEEALAIVRQADVAEPKYDRAGRHCYTERHWVWPQSASKSTIALIYNTLSHVGDPVGSDGKAIFAWDKGFLAGYSKQADAAKAEILENLAALPSAPTRKAIYGQPRALSGITRVLGHDTDAKTA